MIHHRLVIRDRGVDHRHRWAPECACGCLWKGQFRRRKAEAEQQYHTMVEAGRNVTRNQQQARGVRRRGRKGLRGIITPLPMTAQRDLPEELRRTPSHL